MLQKQRLARHHPLLPLSLQVPSFRPLTPHRFFAHVQRQWRDCWQPSPPGHDAHCTGIPCGLFEKGEGSTLDVILKAIYTARTLATISDSASRGNRCYHESRQHTRPYFSLRANSSYRGALSGQQQVGVMTSLLKVTWQRPFPHFLHSFTGFTLLLCAFVFVLRSFRRLASELVSIDVAAMRVVVRCRGRPLKPSKCSVELLTLVFQLSASLSQLTGEPTC